MKKKKNTRKMHTIVSISSFFTLEKEKKKRNINILTYAEGSNFLNEKWRNEAANNTKDSCFIIMGI